MPRLEEWRIAYFQDSETVGVDGFVYEYSKAQDGLHWVTTPIQTCIEGAQSKTGMSILTKSGTQYDLGAVSPLAARTREELFEELKKFVEAANQPKPDNPNDPAVN